MKKLRFEDLPETLEIVLEQLENICVTLKEINEKVKKEDNNRLMTRYEVADYFKVSITTIHHWTKRENSNLMELVVGYIIKKWK